MKFVLDASIAIKWVLPEPDSAKALALQNDFRENSHELLAPDTLPVEVAHALTRAERQGLLMPGEAAVRLIDILATGPELHSYLVLLPRAIELSSQFRIGVFDCLYVALAQFERCRVVTADQRMVALFPSEVVALTEL
jgi:predicted nucleic acid-binding protein